MAALQSWALAAAGFAVLQVDLYGCGDSAGEFGDATWSGWIDDVVVAAKWLRERTQCVPSLWGLRVGCLIASQAATQMDDAPAHLLYWQPVHSGSQYLQQFLRLRVAGQLMGGPAAEPVGTAALRAELLRGVAVEVGGYRLSGAVASGLDAAVLSAVPSNSRITLLEVSATDPPELVPATRARISEWRVGGHDVVAQAVTGVAFWTTNEIAECSALIAATVAAVVGPRR